MSLAVAEKRPQQRNGGCVGIFFQLFSKKKLFSKKLLPPPPAAKFAAADKMHMTRFLLIAEENRGGFPKVEPGPGPDLESRMQAPGIVARLMGLESMPVVNNEKPRKALDSKFFSESSLEHARIDQGLFVDSACSSKVESRPLKLQKTGGRFLERRPVEIFQKGLIYGGKKKKHTKLDSPLKSPRLLTRSSTSRLVQVANKILEPGLQSRSRAKCAITYIGSLEEDRRGGGEVLRDLIGGSCNSCGNSVGAKGSSATECVSSGSEFSYGSEDRKKIKTPMHVQRKNGQVTIQTKLKAEEMYKMKEPVVNCRQDKNRSVAMQATINVASINHDLMKREKHLEGSGDHYGRSVIGKNRSRQQQLSPVKDRVVTRTKICNEEQSERNMNELHRAKNFVAMNKNINNYTRSRSPTKVSVGCRVELERDGCQMNLTQKRSPANRNMEAFSTNRRVRNDVVSRKGMEPVNNLSVNNNCIKSKLGKISNDNNGIVSFTFSSPMRRDSRSRTNEQIARERRNHGELKGDVFHSKKLIPDAKIGRLSSHEGLALRGDELSNLLEEKIRELSSLDHDELTSDDLQGRSTVSILEDLISALTTRTPELRKDDSRSEASTLTEIDMSNNQLFNVEEGNQVKAQAGNRVSCLDGVTDQPSPVSILGASFSNYSCSLGSVNGSSGTKPHLNVHDVCNNNTHISDMDSDLLDSATSSNISQSVNKTSSICKVGVSETKLETDCEAISDAELLFENIALYGSDRMSSLDSFLLDVLESIQDDFCQNYEPAKDGSRPREFLFACIMECWDAKFSHFCRSGFRTWLKLPSILGKDRLMIDFDLQIREWGGLAGKAMDVLVEKDMDGSDSKWTVCEAEAFDTGVEIQSDILQALIDEMVIDLHR